jgi:UDP-glucuronate 4-epimerase
MTLLVTGAAGFIGYHLARRLSGLGQEVVGLDNLNDYYDVSLKEARLAQLEGLSGFRFVRMDLADEDGMKRLFAREKFDAVVNLAAQPGVRYSLVNPQAFVRSNITGFLNVLEGCARNGVKHLVYASSSSVYGANTLMPFSVHQNVDHPVSLYGATKKANELIAHSYSHLFGLPTTGLRFFTVYGPWGRPDMAIFKFTKSIFSNEPIPVYNNGEMSRDFTYIDDIVEAVARLIKRPPAANQSWSSDAPDPATSTAPFRVYNIGNNRPESLLRLIEILEECIGRKAIKQFMPMQPGDVKATFADVDDLMNEIQFAPLTPLEVGIKRFVRWYRSYYGVPEAASSAAAALDAVTATDLDAMSWQNAAS